MAEIHVEPKKQASNSWIWIVLALLIAGAVIYYLMTRNKADDTVAPPANTSGSIEGQPELPTIKDWLVQQKASALLC